MAESEVILKQKNKSGLDFEIKLVAGRELQISNNIKKIKQSYSVDILSLQDKSKKTIFIAWKWLIAAAGFILIMLLLLKILPAYLGLNKNIYLAGILLTGVAGSLICLVKFFKYTSKKQIFYSRNAHVPIITLIVNNPSQEIFTTFVDAVEKRIKKFRAHMDIAEEKQLTGEMKMLRRLSDRGIISKKEYEQAKARLFTGFDSNFINRDV